MKKLILLASVAMALLVYQPVKAQVSLNLSIGARPYYVPAYDYAYVAPARTVVYTRPVIYNRPVVYRHHPVIYQKKRYVNYRSYTPAQVYHTSYQRSAYRNYPVKHVNYHGRKFGKGHGRGRH